MFDQLLASADAYAKALASIQHDRQLWRQEKRGLVGDVFRQVAERVDLNLKVVEDASTTGFPIALAFPNTVSGFLIHTTKGFKETTQKGAKIRFRQLYNGRIVVGFFSFADPEANVEPESEVMAEHSPQELDEALVLRYVEQFFVWIKNWELKAY